jgi:pimeloyl-ACP methyl ester carboxylesterase
MGEGTKGDVLYLHGFSDRIDNHRPLFESLTKQGLRVIAFDYPSHGETCGPSLDRYSFTDLAKLAGQVERENAMRGPLYLAGWSTGGLLAVRIAQGLDADFSRPIAKMALFAPGVDVRFVTSVSESTLTRNPNPPHVAAPSPTSPLKRPVFASALKLNSELAKVHTLPAGLPVLTFVGGEDADVYADTKGVSKWARTQAMRGAESRLVLRRGEVTTLNAQSAHYDRNGALCTLAMSPRWLQRKPIRVFGLRVTCRSMAAATSRLKSSRGISSRVLVRNASDMLS